MRTTDLYNSRYILHEDGRVYSNIVNRYLKEYQDHNGYYYYRLSNGTKSVHWFKHKLIATFFIPKIEGKDFVNHIDGIKTNNDLTNLEWCTLAENNKHARDTGLNPISKTNSLRWDDLEFRESTSKKISDTRIKSGVAKGRLNPSTKIDLLYAGKHWTMTELSEELGVTVSALNNMKRKLKLGLASNLSIKHNISYISNEKGLSTIES